MRFITNKTLDLKVEQPGTLHELETLEGRGCARVMCQGGRTGGSRGRSHWRGLRAPYVGVRVRSPLKLSVFAQCVSKPFKINNYNNYLNLIIDDKDNSRQFSLPGRRPGSRGVNPKLIVGKQILHFKLKSKNRRNAHAKHAINLQILCIILIHCHFMLNLLKIVKTQVHGYGMQFSYDKKQ